MAMFSLAIDSSLRSSDLVALNVSDVMMGDIARERATIEQKKTKERVTFSMSDYTRVAVRDLVREEDKSFNDPLFASRKGLSTGKRITVNWYRKLVKQWISLARLDPVLYGSHSIRRTRVAHIYRKTGNLKVAQLLLGHKNIEMTANYLGIEEEQALGIAEQFEL
ncbi:MAG: tyrosine-type recombinase/integrase [Hyphomicrobiales bacterium]|nr:tyrosine-type recombinase/integrase [Hyphomicrobiales bacterium]